MKLSNKYYDGKDGDSYNFHIKDKDLIRQVLVDPKPMTIRLLHQLVLKKSWIEDQGEGSPEGFDYLKAMFPAYEGWLKEKHIKIPTVERLIYKKAWCFVLALFRQDSAYYERIGGMVTFIGYHSDKWGTTKAEHLVFLKLMKEWWNIKDRRDRTKWMIAAIFDYLIKKYERTLFYAQSIDFCIEYLIKHKDEWKINGVYDPANWYPVGKGQINYLVHGRKG